MRRLQGFLRTAKIEYDKLYAQLQQCAESVRGTELAESCGIKSNTPAPAPADSMFFRGTQGTGEPSEKREEGNLEAVLKQQIALERQKHESKMNELLRERKELSDYYNSAMKAIVELKDEFTSKLS